MNKENEIEAAVSAFEDAILEAHVCFYDTDFEELSDEVTSMQFSLGIDLPSIVVDVPADVAQAFLESSEEKRAAIFQHVVDRFAR